MAVYYWPGGGTLNQVLKHRVFIIEEGTLRKEKRMKKPVFTIVDHKKKKSAFV